MKIALACTHGGHLTEMLYLQDAFEGHEVFWITHDHPRTLELELPGKKYFTKHIGTSIIRMLKAFWRIFNIFRTEKPDVVVSTGAAISIPALWLGKLMGKRTAFVETWTRIDEPTLSGRLVYPVSDLFLVQWPEMLEEYGKKAEYVGGLA